jgi:hypothetical protein
MTKRKTTRHNGRQKSVLRAVARPTRVRSRRTAAQTTLDEQTLMELLDPAADVAGPSDLHGAETIAMSAPPPAAAEGCARSEATRLGAKAVGYLRRHARRPYGVCGCDGIVVIARQAWRAALVELEVAA